VVVADPSDLEVAETLKRLNQMMQMAEEQQVPQILPVEILNLLAQLRQVGKDQSRDRLLDQLEAQLNLLQEQHNLKAVQLKEEVRRLNRL
jgi:hypothetical protein